MFNTIFVRKILTSISSDLRPRRTMRVLVMLAVFVTLSTTVHAQAVLIDSGTLDDQKILGPKWTRVNFDPIDTGDHTISLSSDATADIRFTVFEIDGVTGNRTALQTSISGTPTLAQWTGALDLFNQYYLGVWVVAGSGNFSASIESNTVVVPLDITAQPADVTVDEGSAASYSVTATGDGTLSYQWFENDVLISGATAATYDIAATTLSQNGNLYRVDVSDDNTTVSSTSATLTVNDVIVPLNITAQPADVTVDEGQAASFAVTASGDGTLSYQWFENDVLILGATTATYDIAATTLSQAGNLYRVDVIDDNTTVNSTAATLTVNDVIVPLNITAQPVDVTGDEGQAASFSVTASGDGTLSYQWFENDVLIPGATAATYDIAAATLSENGNQYRVDVIGDNTTISSSIATLSVEELIIPVTVATIGQGILDANKIVGPRWVRVDFNALTNAPHTITVTWDSTANVIFKVFNAAGTALSPALQGTNPGVWTGNLDTATDYYLAVWSTSGVANYTATIEAYVPVSIESQPIDRIVEENDDVTFFVAASGSGNLTYQWLANGLPLVGETGDSLTILSATLFEDGTVYNVEVSNEIETVASDLATITVNEPLILGLFSQEADTTTWMLDGPASTLDFDAGIDTDAWGRSLLRIGDLLLVGGDFTGIKPARSATPTPQPFLAALDAVTGQPVTTFQIPVEVDAVVRSLTLSPDGTQVYIGGDFGFVAVDATTGAVDWTVNITNGANQGRVFDVAVSDTQIYLGGDFKHVNNTFRANLARLSLNGQLDTGWGPKATSGFNTGRAAPVQSLALSTDSDTVYVGGNFKFIDSTPISYTAQNSRISLLAVSAVDGTVKAERFSADVGSNKKGLTPHDIAVTDHYVIIAWGGPNYVSFHALDGTRLKQYRAKGDVQSLLVVGDHVFVGHHGEFFQTVANPIPQEAVVSIDPQIIVPYKFHSFRIDDPSFLPEQAWTLYGAFGVWGIAAAEDSIWIAGNIISAGTNDRPVEGLVRFPALP